LPRVLRPVSPPVGTRAPFDPHAYDWSYGYDQAGNRTKKIDNLGDREWVYVYDTSAPGTYGRNNNRLMEVEEYDTSGNQPVLEFVSWYSYSEAGNVTRVVRDEVGTEVYTAHRIDYGKNGEAVLYVLGESWESSPLSRRLQPARRSDRLRVAQ
jgi:YD repeat-containing protein